MQSYKPYVIEQTNDFGIFVFYQKNILAKKLKHHTSNIIEHFTALSVITCSQNIKLIQ